MCYEYEPDDLETYNQNEADDYRNEGDDRDGGTCEMCGDDCEYDSEVCICDACQREIDAENAHDGEDDYLIDGVGFADPGGNSALRAETPDNPRIYPCPTCGAPNRLTPIDVQRGYQCDSCADRDERGMGY
jgi:hypothetical protein